MRILVLSFFMVPFVLPSQKGPVFAGGMRMDYEIVNDSIIISLNAPTTGWIGIGFNDENNIVGSDLLLFHVVDGKPEGIDMHVQGIGDPRQDTDLGGITSFTLLHGKEANRNTEVRFSIPIKSQDQYDFQHTLSKSFWLILAYSAYDDFDHHSIMRRHIPFILEAN